MTDNKDALVEAIRARQARIVAMAEGATPKAATDAEEYVTAVVRPALARIQAEAREAGQRLEYLKGTLMHVEGGARIRETLALPGHSPYGDTRASHVHIDWCGGNDLHVTGRIQNQFGSWPVQERGVLPLGSPAHDVERLVRECLIAILRDC